MLTPAKCDVVTLQRGDVESNSISGEPHNLSEFLSDISPKHKPWDVHRAETDDVAQVFAASPFARHRRYAERLSGCSLFIGFARDPPKDGKQQLKLKDARFCRVRYCPNCQWRRSLMWQARIRRALPKLVVDYPHVRFLFATFTVKNCDVHLLRLTLGEMRKAWKRLIELKVFPAIGWVRSTEITRGRDGRAHPHFHCLLMVQPEYFKADYLKQPEWAALWRQSLRVDYTPVVDIRVVDPEYQPWRRTEVMVDHPVWNAAAEILKYSVKVSDMLKDDKWFLTVSDETWKIRAVAVGGVLKQYLKDRAREDLLEEPGDAPPSAEESKRLYFNWKQLMRRYRRVS
jgi:plasmid rolling circle replication initiator protein Rep